MSESPIRVVAAVIEHEGQFLLAQRAAHKSQGGLWEFPGGKIDQGESPQAALRRELLEELGVSDAVVGELVGQRDHRYGAMTVRIEAYRVTCRHEALKCLEHQAIGWFDIVAMKQVQLAPADEFLIALLSAEERSRAPSLPGE
jgi:mutator protein MutT